MSWSIMPVQGRSDDADGLRAALIAKAQPQQPYGEEESRIAIAVAIDTIIQLAGQGVCGSYVQVSASGHANPGHVPEPGWAADAFTLSISAATPPQEEPS